MDGSISSAKVAYSTLLLPGSSWMNESDMLPLLLLFTLLIGGSVREVPAAPPLASPGAEDRPRMPPPFVPDIDDERLYSGERVRDALWLCESGPPCWGLYRGTMFGVEIEGRVVSLADVGLPELPLGGLPLEPTMFPILPLLWLLYADEAEWPEGATRCDAWR